MLKVVVTSAGNGRYPGPGYKCPGAYASLQVSDPVQGWPVK